MKKYITLNIQTTQKLFLVILLAVVAMGELLVGKWFSAIVDFALAGLWMWLLQRHVDNELNFDTRTLNIDKGMVLFLILINSPILIVTPLFFFLPVAALMFGYICYELFKLNISQEAKDKIKAWFYK